MPVTREAFVLVLVVAVAATAYGCSDDPPAQMTGGSGGTGGMAGVGGSGGVGGMAGAGGMGGEGGSEGPPITRDLSNAQVLPCTHFSEARTLSPRTEGVDYLVTCVMDTNSSANRVRHAVIRNAGSNYVYCCDPPAALYIRAGQMSVEDSGIYDSGGCGIGFRSAANLTQTQNAFLNNADGNVCAD